jgi:hypothetical protein
MTQPAQNPAIPETSKGIRFTSILSIASLIGAALFFSGYVYRWTYFSYFLLNIAELNFPAETYPILPVQVFCGTPWLVLRTLLFVLLTALAIRASLWGLQRIEGWVRRLPNLVPRRTRFLAEWLVELTDAMSTLLHEVVIVIGILIMLFWVSRWQGTADARRDAYNDTSKLPTIALVMPDKDKKVALGRLLADPTMDPALSGFRFFGDRTLFDRIYRKEDNFFSKGKDSRVWRMLLSQDNWLYLISSVPGMPKRVDERPLVLALQQKEGGQQMILGPSQSIR